MIRFVLKSALALGLLAAVVPLGTGRQADGPAIDLFGLAVGVQQAVSDLGGFCTRAPQACAAGRDVAAYAGERVQDGVRIAYGYLTEEGKPAPREAETRVAAAPAEAAPDPLTTGAVETFPLPRPYLPPKPAALAPATVEAGFAPSVVGGVAVPTPAPRG